MSELALGQLKGLTVNSNKITVPSGHTLYAPGHVLQVVNGQSAARVANTSSTWVSTTVSASITPKSNTSKFMVMVTHPISLYGSSGGNGINIRLTRNGTTIWQSYGSSPYTLYYTTGSTAFTYSIDVFDAPATTSTLTYSTDFYSYGANFAVNSNANDAHIYGSITIFEVAA